MVLCAGGGTSGLLANALNKAAAEYNVPVKAAAGGYGAHREMLPEFDLVILAPQVASNYEDMEGWKQINLELNWLRLKELNTSS